MFSADVLQSATKKLNLTDVSLEDQILCFTSPLGHTYSLQFPSQFPNRTKKEAVVSVYGPDGFTADLSDCTSLLQTLERVLQLASSSTSGSSSRRHKGGDGTSRSEALDVDADEGDVDAEEEEEMYFEEYDAADMDCMGTPQQSEHLCMVLQDVEAYRAQYGANAVRTQPVDSGVWIIFNVPIGDLVPPSTATAWGIDRQMPLQITLKFSSYYTKGDRPPEVAIRQSNEEFPFGQHMCRIVRSLLKESWTVSEGFQPRVTADNNASVAPPPPPYSAPKKAAALPSQSTIDAQLPLKTAAQNDLTKNLIQMGFDKKLSDRVARWFDDLDSCVDVLVQEEAAALIGKKEVEHYEQQLLRQQQEKAASTANSNKKVEAPSQNPAPTKPTVYDPRTDPVKNTPYHPSKGLLIFVADVLRARIPSCSTYCVLCDCPHIYGGASMARPAVCARDLCVFAFSDLKVGSDSAATIATSVTVVELLLVMFCNAVLSSRAEQVTVPFPSIADPEKRGKLLFDPNAPDVTLLKKIVTSSMQPYHGAPRSGLNNNSFFEIRELAAKSDKRGPLVMDWVVNSNRSFLIQVTDRAKQLPEFHFADQYLLMMAPPEKQSIFDEWKRKKGTKFAFHGSRVENWHSILRNGLKSMSGTAMQLNGSAHGKGIYFAPEAQHSLGYCGSSAGSTSWNCMALCEIINDDCITDHGWCWTVLQEDKVMTRMLFVFQTSGSLSGVDTRQSAFQASIHKTLASNGL